MIISIRDKTEKSILQLESIDDKHAFLCIYEYAQSKPDRILKFTMTVKMEELLRAIELIEEYNPKQNNEK